MAPLRLKEWLVAQVESGRYPGLRWEEGAGKSLFRIPWKHAAKQGYRQQQDAALFRAWAIYKGKYQEGQDKADPSVWKTRLRCALNKSADFQEVPERSHLDISEPYKVYRIISQDTDKENSKESALEPSQPSSSGHQEARVNCKLNKARGSSNSEQDSKDEPMMTGQNSPVSQAFQKPNQLKLQGSQVKRTFCSWSPPQFHPQQCFISCSSQHLCSENINSDCWLHVQLFYCNVLVKEITTSTAEGCRITYRPVLTDNECLYGPNGMEQIQFPSPDVLAGSNQEPRAMGVLERLLPHLHRGVLVWVAPEGVFMKRQCQGRVYWDGPLAPHHNQPNKLEREKTYKLLDTQQFLQQLRGYLTHGQPPPLYQIRFCFGEEYPAAPNQKLHKFIMAHVEPVLARDLFRYAHQLRPCSLQDSQSCHSDAPRSIAQILKQLCPP